MRSPIWTDEGRAFLKDLTGRLLHTQGLFFQDSKQEADRLTFHEDILYLNTCSWRARDLNGRWLWFCEALDTPKYTYSYYYTRPEHSIEEYMKPLSGEMLTAALGSINHRELSRSHMPVTDSVASYVRNANNMFKASGINASISLMSAGRNL